MKLLVHRKITHIDQYLDFASHHPLQHKWNVVRLRTFHDRCSKLVTEDQATEEVHMQEALSRCEYLDWSIRNVRRVKSETEVV